jgi:ribose 5-phosphate isomerase B
MQIAVGSDHAGFRLKEALKRHLVEAGHEVTDHGTWNESSSDYPDFAHAVARAVAAGEQELGVFCCGSGIGPSIVANKVPGIRAAAVSDTFSAHMSREHNNTNVLCLGQRVVGDGLAADIVDAWLNASYSEDERHHRRVDKITLVEQQYACPQGEV